MDLWGRARIISLMLISGGPGWMSVGCLPWVGVQGTLGVLTWELVEEDILLSPHLFSIAPLHPS